MRWDEGSLRGTTRLKTLTRSSEKLGCADLFRQDTFPLLANIGVLRAGRAQPLYLLTPSGRFGPSAQQPTGLTLPIGACGAAGETRAGFGFHLEGCGPPNLPGRVRSERENAFSPLFAPDIGGGPSGIGRGSAETGARRGP